MFVLDASVLVADLRPAEPSHREAAALLDYVRQHDLPVALPAIALAEVAGAVARGTGKTALAQRAVLLLQGTVYYQWIAVDAALAARAAALAGEYRLRGYDAVYLALAQQLDVPLVTLDLELTRRKPADVQAERPETHLARLRAG